MCIARHFIYKCLVIIWGCRVRVRVRVRVKVRARVISNHNRCG